MPDLKLPILGSPSFEEDARTFTKEVRERNTRLHQDALHKNYENVLFNYGLHWVTFDNLTQTWRPKAMKPWVPKPVTNKYAAVLRPLVSTLAGTDPILQYAPTSEQPEDVATANVASRIVEICRQETNIQRARPKLARWLALTGNTWLISGYDKDERYGMVPEQLEQCVSCGNTMSSDDVEAEGGCPFCLKAGVESQGFMPAVDQFGAPQMGQRPRGSMFSELSTVFEMEYDHEANSFEESLYAMRFRTRDKEYAKSHFGLGDDDLKDAGIAGLGSVVQQRYLESLAFISPLSYQLYFARPHRENRVLITDLWIDPTMENPDGAYIVLVGNNVVWSGPYKYHSPDSAPDAPKPMRPITHFGYEVAPGRVAYRTPADDLVPKQRTRNELESIYKLHSRRAANSIVWIPDGSNMSKMVGEEGLIVRFTAMSGVPAPRREPGLETPQFIEKWMAMIDMEMEELSGAVDIMRGEAPKGLESYAALQALEAKAMQALSEPKTLWAMAWSEWAKQMLGIFKEYCIDSRDFSMRGENGAWSIQQFKAADLRGGVRIIPDLASTGPSSPVAKAARYEQGVRLGFVNINDPQERYTGWKILGLPEVMVDMDLDVMAAAKENDKFVEIFVKGGQEEPPAVNPFVDNHLTHRATHVRFAKSDKWDQLGPLGQGALVGHIAQHDAVIVQQMMAQQGAQKPMSQEGKMGGGTQGGPSADKTVKSEAGAASQPERANDMGKPKSRNERLGEMRSEQNVEGARQ